MIYSNNIAINEKDYISKLPLDIMLCIIKKLMPQDILYLKRANKTHHNRVNSYDLEIIKKLNVIEMIFLKYYNNSSSLVDNIINCSFRFNIKLPHSQLSSIFEVTSLEAMIRIVDHLIMEMINIYEYFSMQNSRLYLIKLAMIFVEGVTITLPDSTIFFGSDPDKARTLIKKMANIPYFEKAYCALSQLNSIDNDSSDISPQLF